MANSINGFVKCNCKKSFSFSPCKKFNANLSTIQTQWLPLSTTGWSMLFYTITSAIISNYDQYHVPNRLLPEPIRAVIFPYLDRMSLHPIRRVGRPDLTIVKTLKKFSKVKLLNFIFLNINFRKKRSKNAQSYPFFGISTAIFQLFLPKYLQNRRFFLFGKNKAWQKRELRAKAWSSFLVRAPVFSFHESAK